MCFFMETNVGQELLCVKVLVVFIFTTSMFRRLNTIEKDLSDLNGKFDYNKVSHEESLKIVKKTVEQLKEGIRENKKALKEMIKELRLYKADQTGLVDYAFRGRVKANIGTETYSSEGVLLHGTFSCGQSDLKYLEGRIVEPSVLPGECWPIKGQHGSATIDLITEINVRRVSVEHAPKELLHNGTDSAPKEFSLIGLPPSEASDEPAHFFGRFTYSIDSTEVQTFTVQNASPKYFKRVEVQILSNHGNSKFTCVYRVRIHGDPRN